MREVPRGSHPAGGLRAFVQLSRPFFLLGGALLYLLGAVATGARISWTDYATGQALVTAVQLSAQYSNEYFDIAADRLAGDRRTWLTGGSGVLAAGGLAPPTALVAAVTTSAVALALVAVVAGVNGWASVVGLVALFGAWAYSAPPARLVATPFGVTAASLIVAVLTPLTGALVQGGAPTGRFLGAIVPLFLLHHAMLIAFERPDLLGDTSAGKRTLSVRLGPTHSRRLHSSFIVGAYGALVIGLAGPLTGGETAWALAFSPAGAAQALSYARGSDTMLVTTAMAVFAGTTLGLAVGLA